MARYALIADDFTGAMDSAAQFAESGLSTYLHLAGDWPEETAVLAFSTASRHATPSFARQSVADISAKVKTGRFFKKIDSTLRGHLLLEINTTLVTSGLDFALVCPAAVSAGRTVLGGNLYVQGVTLDQSDFRNDPFWPMFTSSLQALLSEEAVYLPIALVRRGKEALLAEIHRSKARLFFADAETREDLEVVAAAAAHLGCLPCGALDLAKEWLRVQEPEVKPSIQSYPGWVGLGLMVVGSVNAQARRQVDHLRQMGHRWITIKEVVEPSEAQAAGVIADLRQGKTVVLTTPAERMALLDIGKPEQGLAWLVAGVFSHQPVSNLVIIGGETAQAVCGALQLSGVWVGGLVQPGVAWGWFSRGNLYKTILITKAGGFGQDDTLTSIIDGSMMDTEGGANV